MEDSDMQTPGHTFWTPDPLHTQHTGSWEAAGSPHWESPLQGRQKFTHQATLADYSSSASPKHSGLEFLKTIRSPSQLLQLTTDIVWSKYSSYICLYFLIHLYKQQHMMYPRWMKSVACFSCQSQDVYATVVSNHKLSVLKICFPELSLLHGLLFLSYKCLYWPLSSLRWPALID